MDTILSRFRRLSKSVLGGRGRCGADRRRDAHRRFRVEPLEQRTLFSADAWSLAVSDAMTTYLSDAEIASFAEASSDLGLTTTSSSQASKVTVDATSVTVEEGQTATITGKWSGEQADWADVTLTASVGTVTKNADRTWSWSCATSDGPQDGQSVTITAHDEGVLDFQSLSVATVTYGKYHDHYMGTRMAAYEGSIFFSLWDDGSETPAKILQYDPASGLSYDDTCTTLVESSGKFTGVQEMDGELYMSDSLGNVWTYDGTTVSLASGTPFSATNYVYGMTEFNGKEYFGTTAGTVYQFDGSTYTPVFQAASSTSTIVDLCAWNGSLYVAPWYDNLYKSNGTDLTSWSSVITGVCTTANAQMLPTPDSLYIGVIDNGSWHGSTVRRSEDGVHFTTIAGPGPFKWDFGALWYGDTAYFFQNGNAGGPDTSGTLVVDDGGTVTATSMGGWNWRIRSAVVLDGEVYAIANALDCSGGVAQDQYLLTTAGCGLSESVAFDLVVNNAAPTCSVTAPAVGVPGQPLAYTLTAADASSADQAAGFTYQIDWGDGSSQTIPQSPGNGVGAAVTHCYAALGQFTAKVTATDKDGAVSAVCSATTGLQSVVITPAFGVTSLLIGGTSGNDTILVGGAGHVGDVAVFLNQQYLGIFAGSQFQSIGVYGGEGDDTIRITNSVREDVFLFGGNGHDRLYAGGSNAALIGGAGNDLLAGGAKASLLVGGAGQDFLLARGRSSLLIGGVTDYDCNDLALASLLQEWSRTDVPYRRRLAHIMGDLAGGLNGSFALNVNTVHDDAARDLLLGGSELDTFFASRKDIPLNVRPTGRIFIV